MDRDLIEVVEAMKKLLTVRVAFGPAIEPEACYMFGYLQSVESSVQYAPPEVHYLFWNKISECLEKQFPDPAKLEPWQRELCETFVGPKGTIATEAR